MVENQFLKEGEVVMVSTPRGCVVVHAGKDGAVVRTTPLGGARLATFGTFDGVGGSDAVLYGRGVDPEDVRAAFEGAAASGAANKEV